MARRNFFARGRWSGGNGLRSINSLTTDYKKFVGVVDSEAERIMQGAADIQLQATLPFVPLETGALRESGRATVMRTAKGVAALVSFGGEEAPVMPTKNAPDGYVYYAAVVNYDTNMEHAVGQAMYLEAGAAASQGAVDNHIVSELRKITP